MLVFSIVVGFQVDTGFWIWSFQGKILKRLNIETFCGLQWRPRLSSLLSPKQQQEIRKNLKKYSAQFESKDRMRQSRASKVSAVDIFMLYVDFDGISYCCLLIKEKLRSSFRPYWSLISARIFFFTTQKTLVNKFNLLFTTKFKMTQNL